MFWAPVRSKSCLCWLYRASLPLAAKNIINLISVLTIWWCPCVESSLVLLEESVCMTSVFSWQNSVSLCPASFCTPRQTCSILQVSLDFLLLHSSPLSWKEHLFWAFVLEGLVGLHRIVSFFGISVWGIDLDYCDVEWFALEMNRDHSVVFEIALSTAFWTLLLALRLLHSF